jgi:hypothetical protein
MSDRKSVKGKESLLDKLRALPRLPDGSADVGEGLDLGDGFRLVSARCVPLDSKDPADLQKVADWLSGKDPQ